jgi:hypothetical protein
VGHIVACMITVSVVMCAFTVAMTVTMIVIVIHCPSKLTAGNRLQETQSMRRLKLCPVDLEYRSGDRCV